MIFDLVQFRSEISLTRKFLFDSVRWPNKIDFNRSIEFDLKFVWCNTLGVSEYMHQILSHDFGI